jgi:hypothetical protein
MKKTFVPIVTLAVAAVLWPSQALAHGLVQRANLPIPEWLFGWAASIVLIVSFVGLAFLWPQPRLEGADGWRSLPGSAGRFFAAPALDIVAGTIGVLLWLLVIVAGFAGAQEATDNFAPIFVFITFWVGLVFASLFFGDVYRLFNPWRAIGRATGFLAERLRGRPAEHKPYPERLGLFPAALGLLAFTWLELASKGWGETPDILATIVVAYSVWQFWGMAVYGVEPWISRAETFSVYFNLFARISVWERRDGRLGLRRPLSALTSIKTLPGTVALVAVMIGTVTFDGLSQGKTWSSMAADIQKFFESVGFTDDGAERLTNTTGLLLSVALVAAFYALGIAGARSVGGTLSAERLRRGFVHSLIPIALVYVIAHYLTFFLFEGQQIFALLSDPLGRDWDLLGTAGSGVDYGVLSQNSTWYLQVGFVVAGHVAALVLAHERALILYKQTKLAVRSQYWMLAVMVGFTSMALWLLAQAGTATTVAKKPVPAAAAAPPSDRLVDLKQKPPFVNALDIDPENGDFLLTTNRGFWRIDEKSGKVEKIPATITGGGKKDTIGTFLLLKHAGGRKLIGSGHPDNQNTLPQFVGYIESEDMGRTWKVASRLGDADLHKIELKHGKLYAFDAVLSVILESDDMGKTFIEHSTPRGLILDFVVDPEDPKYILADNDDELFVSTDTGDSWKRITAGSRMRLAWPAKGFLYRADQDGNVYTSPDRGATWKQISKVAGEPYKFKETEDPKHLYLALGDGTIVETTDAAKTWKTVFKP